MKNNRFTSAILSIVAILYCVFAIDLNAQMLEEENTKVMSRMDTESFKGKIVLNKAIALKYQLESFRKREKEKDGAYRIHLDGMLLRHLIEIAKRGDMDEIKKLEIVEEIFARSR